MLVGLVGNPWPGRTRLELRDEVGVIAGVLAALAWLIWARFVLAVVIELRDQLAALRVEAPTRSSGPSRARRARPGPWRLGILAQRLVAAALIILPLATRCRPSGRGRAGGAARRSGPRRARRRRRDPRPVRRSRRRSTRASPQPTAGSSSSTGDTLIGLARAHLGDPGSLAGDLRPQPRSTPGRWRSVGDAEPDPPRLAAAPARLERRRRARSVPRRRDDHDRARRQPLEPVPGPAGPGRAAPRRRRRRRPRRDVIAANGRIVEDPDLIYPGERFEFPAVGTPPPARRLTRQARSGNRRRRRARSG